MSCSHGKKDKEGDKRFPEYKVEIEGGLEKIVVSTPSKRATKELVDYALTKVKRHESTRRIAV